MGRYYILRNDQVIEEPDHEKWLQWRETSFEQVRTVAQTNSKFGSISSSLK